MGTAAEAHHLPYYRDMLLLSSARLVGFFLLSKTRQEGKRKGVGGVPEVEEVLELGYLPCFGCCIKGEWQQPSCQRTVSSVTHPQHTETDFQILPETVPALLQLFGHLHT